MDRSLREERVAWVVPLWVKGCGVLMYGVFGKFLMRVGVGTDRQSASVCEDVMRPNWSWDTHYGNGPTARSVTKGFTVDRPIDQGTTEVRGT
jgi:hypothetical protein